MILLYHTYTIISAFLFFQITILIFSFTMQCFLIAGCFTLFRYMSSFPQHCEFIFIVTLFMLHVNSFHLYYIHQRIRMSLPFCKKEADYSTSVIKNYAL